MGRHTIGEAAARSGFAASTLRYYEDLGLVVPAERTAAGYRLYGDDELARLAFIARAKHLGCRLDEIVDLVDLWDGTQCRPVQHRFHELVTEKLADTRRRIAELTAFADQLAQAADHLAGPASDLGCDEHCACLTVGTASGPAPVALGARSRS